MKVVGDTQVVVMRINKGWNKVLRKYLKNQSIVKKKKKELSQGIVIKHLSKKTKIITHVSSRWCRPFPNHGSLQYTV